MRKRSECICNCHSLSVAVRHATACCEPDPVSEFYEVTLRVERRPDWDHPGDWDWEDMIGSEVAVIRAVREDEI